MAKSKDKKVKEEVKENSPTQSTLYYFYTVGCGFCKKAEPIVDELIKEGHDILKLDLAEPDNRGLKDEISKKYNKQCGTPWFIDAETGKEEFDGIDNHTFKIYKGWLDAFTRLRSQLLGALKMIKKIKEKGV